MKNMIPTLTNPNLPFPWKSWVRIAVIFVLFPVISCMQSETVFASDGIQYEVSIHGVSDSGLKKSLESISETFSLRERLPASLGHLKTRAKRDVSEFRKFLRAKGYYGERIDFEIDSNKQPMEVRFQIETGPPYLFEDIHISLTDEARKSDIRIPSDKDIGLVPGRPGESKAVLDAEKSLIDRLKAQGYAFAEVAERKVIVDHAKQTVAVRFKVSPGPKTVFGHTKISGLDTIKEDFVRTKLTWKEGDLFSPSRLRTSQMSLLQTDLFSTVQIKTKDRPENGNRLPVVVVLKERKRRSFKIGGSYRTDEGLGGRFSWENRNVFGRGERLTLALIGSEIGYSGEGELRKPAFLRDDQALLFKLRAAQDKPDAFTSRNINASVQVERKFSKELTGAAGLAFRASDIEQFDESDTYTLISLPATLNWDTSDDLLNPTRGGRLGVQIEPYYDLLGTTGSFVKGMVTYSRYTRILKQPSVVFAARAAFGMIGGADRDGVPADIRFYAGGGGSIRGYSYQTVGPLEDDEPVGGRSLFEFSTELRVRITNKIGLAAFLDGGSAFESMAPDFNETIRWGAGMGLRYYTPIGPLRLDAAIPLNRRDNVDDSFQIYISLGQAF